MNGLASTPFNIAVGGTQFNENGADSTYWSSTNAPDQSSALGYIPENVWNESCADPNVCGVASLFASSGGVSTLYVKPSWQVGPGVPNDGKRDLPDVSFHAAGGHYGYLLCQDGICTTNASGQLINAELVGGTSAAAPTFAAIMALIAQKTNSRQGQANFVLYPLAAGQNAANCNASGPPQAQCLFNDITVADKCSPVPIWRWRNTNWLNRLGFRQCRESGRELAKYHATLLYHHATTLVRESHPRPVRYGNGYRRSQYRRGHSDG